MPLSTVDSLKMEPAGVESSIAALGGCSLAELIDRAIVSGAWYGITIFADRDGEGPRVALLRDVSTAVVDQCADATVPASERLMRLLESNVIAAEPMLAACEFDDILG